MSFSSHNGFDRSNGAIEAEQTLRLIASLPAPQGIEERVKAGLRETPGQAQLIRWPLTGGGSHNGWMHSQAMRAAAAAAIVIAVAGGGWAVYSHIQMAPEPAAVTAPPTIDGRGGLSTAGTKRVPQTLEGPVVAPSVEKEKTGIHSGAAASSQGKVTKKLKTPLPSHQ